MSEHQRADISSLESIEKNVGRLEEAILPEVIIVGSAAVYAALGNAVRTPHDIDLSVSEPAYNYLRTQPGWEPKQKPDEPAEHLYNGNLDITLGWAEQNHKALLARSWRSPGGLAVANLADVYAWKQHRNNDKDQADTADIRRRLQDPSQPPLPISIMPDEIRRVKSILPEWLHDHPDASAALWIAANGLMGVFTQYGHPDIGRANQIIGKLELPEYNTVATYHNGFYLEEDMQTLMTHMQLSHASAADYLLAIMVEPHTDYDYGNGRLEHHPEGINYDEWLSAQLMRARTLMAGFSETEADRSERMVQGTTYNELTMQQEGTDDPDPLVRAITGVDRQGLAEPDAIMRACDLAIEDGTSARSSPERILGKVFTEAGVRITSTEQALKQIDADPDARPAGASSKQTAIRAYAGFLAGSATLFDPSTGIYRPPFDWTLDRPHIRRIHAEKFRELSSRLVTNNKNKKITAVQSYEMAHEHAQALHPSKPKEL